MATTLGYADVLVAPAVSHSLVTETVRPLRRQRNSRTLTIVDWDDTILPSNEIFATGIDDLLSEDGAGRPNLPESFAQELRLIEERALAFLSSAASHGVVLVITASEAGWVERSGSFFLPRVLAFFCEHSIRVVSARARYKLECRPSHWKVRAFLDAVAELFPEKADMHVVVVGDGLSECLAARTLKCTFPEMVVKTVKFVESPTAGEVAAQLTLLKQRVSDIFLTDESFEALLSSAL